MRLEALVIGGAVAASFLASAMLSAIDPRVSPFPFCVITLLWGGVAIAPIWKGVWTTRRLPLALVAITVRLPLLFAPLVLSDDLFRYLWEGHALSVGVDPYSVSPAQAVLAYPNDAVLSQVNHPEIVTAYPPGALRLFQLLGLVAYHPLTLRCAAALVDVGTVLLLASLLRSRGRTTAAAWAYALHPLPAIESAANAHLETFAVCALVGAFWAWEHRKTAVSAALAVVGGGLKLAPLVALPAIWRQSRRETTIGVLLGVAVLGVIGGTLWLRIPVNGAGLGVWARHWAFNAPVFPAVETLLGDPVRSRLFVATVIVGVWLAASCRWRDPVRATFWAAAVAVLLSPTVHPWYLLWAWVPALVIGARAWAILATTGPLGYLVFVGFDPSTGQWQEPGWLVWVVFFPFVTALGCSWLLRLTRPGPSLPA